MKYGLCLTLGLIFAGCTDRVAAPTAEQDAAAEGAGQAAGADPPAQQPDEPAKPVPFNKREAKLVDKTNAMAENASLVEVENKINASDPFTAAAQGYFNAVSRVEVAKWKHQVDLMHATDGRWPTFEEFESVLKQNNIKLKGLYPWQMYAYDDRTGGICILEDRAEKKRQYEASGRDYPHDD